jgi:uncharacterized protein (TIGR02246 family)
MKTGLLLVLEWLAISFAVPTFAQTSNIPIDQPEPRPASTLDPEVRQQIEAVSMQFVETFNKHDAAAVAALYTQDAVRVGDWSSGGESSVGREAIEKAFEVRFAGTCPRVGKSITQMYALDDRIAAISEFTQGFVHGHTVKIYVRDANTWKIRTEFATARWESMTHK